MGTRTSEGRIRRRMRMRTLTPPADPDLPADLAGAVAAAALDEHPGATVDRVEVDSAGLYTAFLVTAYGEDVVVQVDRDLTVLGWLAFPR
ncbi:hypothetical protein ACI789_09715 [Geodermatophilus sp. SYSU D00965]